MCNERGLCELSVLIALNVLTKLKVPTYLISILLQLAEAKIFPFFGCSPVFATISCVLMRGAGKDVDAVTFAYVTDRHFGDTFINEEVRSTCACPVLLQTGVM